MPSADPIRMSWTVPTKLRMVIMANNRAGIPVPLPNPLDNCGMVQVANAMDGEATCSFQVSSSASAALVVHRTTLVT